jgi:hypothetical protein
MGATKSLPLMEPGTTSDAPAERPIALARAASFYPAIGTSAMKPATKRSIWAGGKS